MIDLSTQYLGLKLKNPLVASSSPLSKKVESAIQLEEEGVSAIVLYSLFEEQIIQDSLKLHRDLDRGTYSFAEALDYLPAFGQYSIGPDVYIDHLRKMKKSLNIPVIGSLNGVTTGGWTEYARKMQDAGADALELNLYYIATDPTIPSAEVESMHAALVGDVCQQLSVPVAVKLSPFYTAIPNFANRLANSGAKGLVLFNRFYQPDFDLENLEVVPNLVLSNSHEMRLPLRWIAILYGRVAVDLALTTGVHTGLDMLKALMAGARVVTVTSEFLQRGPQRAGEMLDEMRDWMTQHEYHSVQQLTGSMSQQSVAEPASFERANYMKVLSSY